MGNEANRKKSGAHSFDEFLCLLIFFVFFHMLVYALMVLFLCAHLERKLF
jgi:hypothetical protein